VKHLDLFVRQSRAGTAKTGGSVKTADFVSSSGTHSRVSAIWPHSPGPLVRKVSYVCC